MTEDKIYYQKDQPQDPIGWIQGLNQSGYAGVNKQGTIVDRREFPNAIPIQGNSLFNIVKPKPLPEPKPKLEDYGYVENMGFDSEPSGFVIEGGEEAYNKAMEIWLYKQNQEL